MDYYSERHVKEELERCRRGQKIAVTVGALVLILAIVNALSGCDNGPTCEDLGKAKVQTGTVLIPQRVGNVSTFIHVPKYECKELKEG